jgi:hypothetical protein
MSEVNLLIFGCAVSFIAFGGAYVYLRECFEEKRTEKVRAHVEAHGKPKLRDVA